MLLSPSVVGSCSCFFLLVFLFFVGVSLHRRLLNPLFPNQYGDFLPYHLDCRAFIYLFFILH